MQYIACQICSGKRLDARRGPARSYCAEKMKYKGMGEAFDRSRKGLSSIIFGRDFLLQNVGISKM